MEAKGKLKAGRLREMCGSEFQKEKTNGAQNRKGQLLKSECKANILC